MAFLKLDQYRLFPAYAFIPAIFVHLSWPPLNLWPLTFIGFILFTYPVVSERLTSVKSVALHFFIFSFFVQLRISYFQSVMIHEAYAVKWGLAFSLSLFVALGLAFVSAFFGACWGVVNQLIIKTRGFQVFIRPFGLFCFLVAWDAFEPRVFGWKYVQSIASEPLLLATVGTIGTFGWQVVFFGTTIVCSLLLSHINRLWVSLGLSLGCFLMVFGGLFYYGSYLRNQIENQFIARQPVYLLQDNFRFDSRAGPIAHVRAATGVQNRLLRQVTAMHSQYRAKQESSKESPEPWVFWPETSMPQDLVGQKLASARVTRLANTTGGVHIVGSNEKGTIDLGEGPFEAYYNVAALFDGQGYVAHYRKQFPFPFGEYIPGHRFFPKIYNFIPELVLRPKGFDQSILPHRSPKGPVFVTTICWEVLFPSVIQGLISKAQQQYPAREMILVNLSRDGWFGHTALKDLYAKLIQWQAVEFQLSTIKTSDTGLSLVIAPWGEVVATTSTHQEAVIFGELPVKKSTE